MVLYGLYGWGPVRRSDRAPTFFGELGEPDYHRVRLRYADGACLSRIEMLVTVAVSAAIVLYFVFERPITRSLMRAARRWDWSAAAELILDDRQRERYFEDLANTGSLKF
jgi:hypothetical protein